MLHCTKCDATLTRELSRDEWEGGYAYCDRCEDEYQRAMDAEEERLNKEGRSLYGVICGACGHMRSFEHASYGGDCPRCGGYGYDEPDPDAPTTQSFEQGAAAWNQRENA
jgi:uncharacterized CHY-type Zn-finger protein